MLEIEGLNAYYGNIRALTDVSLRVPKGKIVSIIGANGAGKSTLLKSVSGLIQDKSGKILFRDKNIASMPAHRIVRLGISQVPEGRQLFAHLTVEDNLLLGAYHYYSSRNRSVARKQIEEAYGLFPVLKKRFGQIAGTLSGGEQQMLAIARSIMARPDLLLLDEPSMGIAPLIVKEIFKAILDLNLKGTTVLLVEQNAGAALKVAHHAYALEGGKVVLEGIPREFLDNPRVKEVYLGG
jgi:branched-chain amino acid transport system ATP-binding protein